MKRIEELTPWEYEMTCSTCPFNKGLSMEGVLSCIIHGEIQIKLMCPRQNRRQIPEESILESNYRGSS